MTDKYKEQDEAEEKPVFFNGVLMPTKGGGYTYSKGCFFDVRMPMQDSNILFKKRISAKKGLSTLMHAMKIDAPLDGAFVGKPSIDNCLKPETGIPMAGGYINPKFTSELPMDSSFRMRSAVQNYHTYAMTDEISREILTKFEAETDGCTCQQCVAKYQSKVLKIATEQCARTAVYVLNPLMEDIKENVRETEFEKLCRISRNKIKSLVTGIKNWGDLPEKYDELEQILIDTVEGKITEKQIKETGYKSKDDLKEYVFGIMNDIYKRMAESPFKNVYTFLETKKEGAKIKPNLIEIAEEEPKEEPIEEGSWQATYKENGVGLPYSEV